MGFLFTENCRLASFLAVTFPCAFLDAKCLKVPRLPLLALTPFLALTAFLTAPPYFSEAAAGALAGMVSFYIARKMTLNKIGLADVWMAGCIGALGGIRLLAMATVCAMALVLPCSPGKPIPFIPPLLVGTLYSIIIHIFLGN